MIDCRRAWGRLNQEEQANYANTIAGKNAMTGWLALMNSAQDDFNKLSNAIDNSNGAAKGMADIMQDNLEGQLTILKSQLQELSISLGDVMMPTIRKIVGGIQEAVDWLNALDEDTKETIVTVGLVVAAASPLLIILGKAVSAIGSLIGVMTSSKLMLYRIEQLEKKVQAHNNLVERTYKLEKREELLEQALAEHEKLYAEKFKVANHRIEDLEGNRA